MQSRPRLQLPVDARLCALQGNRWDDHHGKLAQKKIDDTTKARKSTKERRQKSVTFAMDSKGRPLCTYYEIPLLHASSFLKSDLWWSELELSPKRRCYRFSSNLHCDVSVQRSRHLLSVPNFDDNIWSEDLTSSTNPSQSSSTLSLRSFRKELVDDLDVERHIFRRKRLRKAGEVGVMEWTRRVEVGGVPMTGFLSF